MDLPLTKNRFRCRRVQNKVGGYDYNVGSTIRGSYGYGFASDPSKNAIGTISIAPAASSSSSSSSSSSGSSTQKIDNQQQEDLEQQKNMNMDTEHFTVKNNLVF
mgnify:CR=1 FL=1